MSSLNEKLSAIIRSDDLSQFKLLSLHLNNINAVINTKSRDNALHLCSIFGSANILKYLLDERINDIDVNARNSDGKTGLHLCSQFGNTVCAKLLIDARADVNAIKRSDWTPLMLTATKSNLDVISLLVNSGALLKLRNKDGWTAFHIAVREGHLPIISYLMKRDNTVWMSKSNTNRTPLHTASLHGHRVIVDYLMKNCEYSSNEMDSCGITPFMESIRANRVDIAQLFIDKQSIDPFVCDSMGRNALHISAESNALNSIKYLIERLNFIACLNEKSKISESTALHLAAKHGHKQTIEMLMDYGAHLDLRDSNGRLPVDIAVASKHFDCVTLLQL